MAGGGRRGRGLPLRHRHQVRGLPSQRWQGLCPPCLLSSARATPPRVLTPARRRGAALQARPGRADRPTCHPTRPTCSPRRYVLRFLQWRRLKPHVEVAVTLAAAYLSFYVANAYLQARAGWGWVLVGLHVAET